MCAKNHLLIFSSFLDIWENVEWPRFFGPPGISPVHSGAAFSTTAFSALAFSAPRTTATVITFHLSQYDRQKKQEHHQSRITNDIL